MSGFELKEFREKHGWTQGQLGDLLGVARNTVARWERDEMAIPPYLPLALETLQREKTVTVKLSKDPSARPKRVSVKVVQKPTKK